MFIQSINDSQYLQWADGSPITVEEMEEQFFVTETSTGQFNLEHKKDDFRIEHIIFHTNETGSLLYDYEEFKDTFEYDPQEEDSDNVDETLQYNVYFCTESEKLIAHVIDGNLIQGTFDVETGEY